MDQMKFGNTIRLDYNSGDAIPRHPCAGGCGRDIPFGERCWNCKRKTNIKYQKYMPIINKLGKADHRCGSCDAYVGGCQHTFHAMLIAIEEKWPMIENLK